MNHSQSHPQLNPLVDVVDDADYFSRHQEEMRLKHSFNDFLVVQEIAGSKKGFADTHVLQQEFLDDRGLKVEIGENVHSVDDDHSSQTVMIHRNNFDEIESIEVICDCGKRTMVKLEFDQPTLSDDDKEFDLEGYSENQDEE